MTKTCWFKNPNPRNYTFFNFTDFSDVFPKIYDYKYKTLRIVIGIQNMQLSAEIVVSIFIPDALLLNIELYTVLTLSEVS